MNLIQKLEKMQEERISRLHNIARESGRYYKALDNPLIQDNIEQAQDENNKADALYYAMQ